MATQPGKLWNKIQLPLLDPNIPQPSALMFTKILDYLRELRVRLNVVTNNQMLPEVPDKNKAWHLIWNPNDQSVEWMTVPDTTKDYILAFDSSMMPKPMFKWIETTESCP